MISKRDALLGRMAVEKGLISQADLEASLLGRVEEVIDFLTVP